MAYRLNALLGSPPGMRGRFRLTAGLAHNRTPADAETRVRRAIPSTVVVVSFFLVSQETLIWAIEILPTKR
jgi:hypothetical protein